LIEDGERTRVIVAIHDVTGDTFLPAIYSGSCSEYSPAPVVPLAPFESGDRSRTTVDISFDDMVAGGYLVAINPFASVESELFDPGNAVACGELNSQEPPVAEIEPTIEPIGGEEVAVTTPPVTGIGPISGQYWSTILVLVLGSMAIAFAAVGLDLRRRAALSIAQRRLFRMTGQMR
jgi:hypothetical protein